ncbi:MAG: VOC family protein [Planctomycetota bacterium]
MAVRPIPKGYHTVTPYLAVKGSRKLLAYVQKAFGARPIDVVDGPRGTVMHAEVKIGDSMVMMGEDPKGRPSTLCLYVRDCDAVFRSAVKAGGKVVRKPADQFYGDRSGAVKDPCGNQWYIHTHIENLTPNEIATRAAALEK